MQLPELLALVDEDGLRQLAARCLPGTTTEPLALLRSEVENRLRQDDYVESVVSARRPPVLALLVELLAADGLRSRIDTLDERATQRAAQWRQAVTWGELLPRDTSHELYRNVLRGAWSNDLQLDASEISLLGILRHELRLTRTEHFLLGFHDSIAHLWEHAHDLRDLLRVLQGHGLIWVVGDEALLAEEMEAPIRRSTGVELDEAEYLRLLDRLNATVLRDVLGHAGLSRSGSKGDLAQRVVGNFLLPSTVLDSAEVSRNDLVDLARNLGLPTSGRKEELIGRIVTCFRTGTDLSAGTVVEVEAPVEPKVLDESAFSALFRPLSNVELHGLLNRLGLPLSGTKEVRIGYLWASRFSESTLLGALKGDVLRGICDEHGVPRGGKRADQVERLLASLVARRPPPEQSSTGEG